MKKTDFIECMKMQEEEKRRLGAESTADLYRATRVHFRTFCLGKKIGLKAVDAGKVAGFITYLKIHGLAVNSVNSYVSNLRAIYNKVCRQVGFIPKTNPFEGIVLKRQETQKRAVPVEVIEKIAKFDFSERPDLAGATDLALFCFMSCGMPFVDLAHLTGDNIREGGKTLEYRRRKTNTLIRIEINPGMKLLLDTYTRADSRYLFPILSDEMTHEQYKASLAHFNNSLKEIGRMLGLPEPFTSYVIRHSWASAAHRAHVDISVISQALGHTSEQMTRTYLTQFDSHELAQANQKVIGKMEKIMLSREGYLI